MKGAARVGASPRLRTRRLRLAPLGADDLAELCRMHRDPRVMATLGGVRGRERTAAFVGEVQRHWQAHGFGYWALREPGSGRLVGRGGLRSVCVAGDPAVEIGYALVPDAQGRGLATELARTCCTLAFGALGLPRLVAFTLPHNRVSRRVMEKTGLRYQGPICWAELPHVLYRIEKRDWEERGVRSVGRPQALEPHSS